MKNINEAQEALGRIAADLLNGVIDAKTANLRTREVDKFIKAAGKALKEAKKAARYPAKPPKEVS